MTLWKQPIVAETPPLGEFDRTPPRSAPHLVLSDYFFDARRSVAPAKRGMSLKLGTESGVMGNRARVSAIQPQRRLSGKALLVVADTGTPRLHSSAHSACPGTHA
jgi:hypothetical protein